MELNKTKRLALRSLLVAGALLLSYVEAQLPVFFTVPGVKLGLTNLVVLFALYRLGWKDALLLNIVRIVLVGLSFGGMFAMVYSLAGGLVSFTGMLLLKKTGRCSLWLVSVAGGVLHNVGQLAVAMFVLQSAAVWWQLPILWISGVAAGSVIGIICYLVLRRVPSVEVGMRS